MQMDSMSGDDKIFGLISPEMLTALSNGINPINGQDRSGVGESGHGASV